MKKNINKDSNNWFKSSHSKMRKIMAPMTAGIMLNMMACTSPAEKNDNKKINASEYIIDANQYVPYLDVHGDTLLLKMILSVNTDFQFYEDSVSKDLALYKNRSISNWEHRKEFIQWWYLSVEEFGNYVKAFKDTAVFDLISKNTGNIIENIENIQSFNNEYGKGYMIIKKDDKYWVYKEDSLSEDGSRQEGRMIIPATYINITNNRCGKVSFIGHKDEWYDLLDKEGKFLSSADRIIDNQTYIKDWKLLLFTQDGSKVQLDAYTIFDNGWDGEPGDVAIMYGWKYYYFGFHSDHMAKAIHAKFDSIEDWNIGDKLKVLIDNRNLAELEKRENLYFKRSEYEQTDARLWKPNKSAKEIHHILSKILPSKANQKRGDLVFERTDTDWNYIFSYKIVGWSWSQKKQILQSWADIKKHFLYEENPLWKLCPDVFNVIEEESIIDENWNPVDDKRVYKTDEKIYFKLMPVTK